MALTRRPGGRRWAAWNWWVPHAHTDWYIGAAVIAAHVLLARLIPSLVGAPPVGDDLGSLASLAAQVTATIVGFLITAMVFFYGLRGGVRLEVADASMGDRIAHAWKSGIITGAAILPPLLWATAWQPYGTGWLVEGLLLAFTLTVARLLRVLFLWLELYRADVAEPEIPTESVGRIRPRV